MDERERDELLEQAISAFRPEDPGGAIRAHPAWLDLGPEDRVKVFEAAARARALEAALAADGLTTTARAVLARIERSR